MIKKMQKLSILILLLLFAATEIQCTKIAFANPSHLPPAPQLPFAYIRSDGNIEPQTLPIIKEENVYTFTDNIFNYTLSIQRGNIMIDGAGYMLQGNRSGKGIYISDANRVTIKNLKLQRFATAITLSESSFNHILGNEITLNGRGITLHKSSNNQIENNIITKNDKGLLLYERCDYNQIIRNKISHSSDTGIWCEGTIPGTSDYISIIENDFIANKRWGILLRSSTESTIIGNNISQNECGIRLSGDASRDSLIAENNISYNEEGIRFSCQYSGEIYQNNFVYNSRQAYRSKLTGVPFIWSLNEKGNYWTDYEGIDSDGDGIGDTAYIINEENQDSYPLMSPAIPIINFPKPTPSPTPKPTNTPSPTIEPTPTPAPVSSKSQEALPPMVLVSIMTCIVFAIVGFGFTLYLKNFRGESMMKKTYSLLQHLILKLVQYLHP